MEVPEKDDILLLADEKFDFDLSLSSSSSANEDDEVFFGPIRHKERCVAASLDLNHPVSEDPLPPASESHFTWSPPTGEKFVEVYKEAHLLALQIESKNKAAQAARPEDLWSQGVERFIQESRLKINLFEKEMELKKSPRSLKRETYYLSGSPLRAPPSQTPLGQALSQGPAHSPHSSPPEDSSTAPPPNQAGPQKKVMDHWVRPRASSVRGRNIQAAAEQPMKRIAASPSSMRNPNETESPRDAPPDKRSAARGGHSVQGKRSLPVPSKLGPKKALFKPRGSAGALPRPSSSSGSGSGVTPSACASPAARGAKSGEPASTPAKNSSPPGARTSQSGRGGPAAAAARPSLQAGPGGASCRQSKVTEVTAEPAQAPTPAALAQVQVRTLERGGPGPSSGSRRSPPPQWSTAWSARGRDSQRPCGTKAMPTPASHFKVPKFSAGDPADRATPASCRAQRPHSYTAAGRVVAHSTPARRSSGPASPRLLSGVRTPVSTRRLSALPTPAGRRLSSLPRATPKTVPGALASPPCVAARRLSSELRKKSAARAAPARASSSPAASRREDSSSDASCSPPSAVPQALSFSPEKSDLAVPKSISAEAVLGAAQPPADAPPREAILVDLSLDQLAITPKAGSPAPVDRPLIDLCETPQAGAAPSSDSRPLVDLLANTPGTDRSAVSKPLRELIDLTSPLIQLSPEADKENVDSPLLKF